ncbi:DUF5916 domain-containing protein [Aliikangiella sp. IMCC44359]|uniref:DUF5916 domain-containing protein n=1 Tax=Aliikangiella sp. IMCC44359 TaxID=3459125 RepID=UPI00403AE3F2
MTQVTLSTLNQFITVKLIAKIQIKIIIQVIFIATFFLSKYALAIEIDGKLTEPEWHSAQSFDSFVQIWPNTGKPPVQSTQTRLFTTSDGIYIGFINQQAPQTRSHKYSGHDQYTLADFNMVFIDFNSDGNTAFEFVATLGGGTMDGTYTRGNQSNRDWDGPWRAAVSEDDNYWYSEYFIPWSIATYKAQNTNSNTRQISVNFQRYNIAKSEAYSYPDTKRSNANFTYEFQPITVDFNNNTSYTMSTYLASSKDFEKETTNNDVGIDLTWKPTPSDQLIATINPDFGQVESDELIVNFTNVETLRTDKRSFFTENQSLFDVRGPDNLRLLNTRRIGGTSDGADDSLYDIAGAIKYIKSFEHVDLGLFLAQEKDLKESQGKTFVSTRWLHSNDNLNIGQLINFVNNPTHKTKAYTTNFDLNYSPSNKTKIFANLLASERQFSSPNNIASNIQGYGATVDVTYSPQRNWENKIEVSYFDDQLDINDMGYIERNNLLRARFTSQISQYNFAADSLLRDSFYKGSFEYSQNTQKENLSKLFKNYFSLRLKSQHRYFAHLNYQTDGINDLISNGNGSAFLPEQKTAIIGYSSPTQSNTSYTTDFQYYQEGLSQWASKASINTKTYFSDSVRFDLTYNYIDSKDWLIGHYSGELRQYARYFQKINSQFIANLSTTSDLTVIAQWYALKAKGLNSYNIDTYQNYQNKNITPKNFNRAQFALQVRYKNQINSNLKLYVIYARNGFLSERDTPYSFNKLLNQSFNNPDENYVLAKFKYTFL